MLMTAVSAADSARPPALKSFSMGDDNKAVAAESVPAGAESSAEDAMNGCPVTAIEKVD